MTDDIMRAYFKVRIISSCHSGIVAEFEGIKPCPVLPEPMQMSSRNKLLKMTQLSDVSEIFRFSFCTVCQHLLGMSRLQVFVYGLKLVQVMS